MEGRNIYAILRPFIIIFSYFFKLFPYIVRESFYDVSSFIPTKLGVVVRMVLLKSLCKCGDNTYIATNVRIKNFKSLNLGHNVSIHENCFIDAIGGVVIGSNVSIAHNTSIVSFNHSWDDAEIPIKYNPLKLDEIQIASDVWIGCGVRILGGAKISHRSVVGAGSILNKTYAPNSIIAGVPARKIKDI